jgi:sterol desaturase/sphingolipid hydroxylase (fatty acid hydroxylase superfamily)
LDCHHSLEWRIFDVVAPGAFVIAFAVVGDVELQQRAFQGRVEMAIKLGLVALLGPHPAAVVIFEILLSTASLFTHTDIAFPSPIERALRRVVVTPSMHRIHHSTRRDETDSNYGFCLSLWDRLFASYRNQPAQPERDMPIGLPEWRDARTLTLWALLLQPFRNVPQTSRHTSKPSPEDPHA